MILLNYYIDNSVRDTLGGFTPYLLNQSVTGFALCKGGCNTSAPFTDHITSAFISV